MILYLSENRARACVARLRERGVPILSAPLDAGATLTDVKEIGGVIIDGRACAVSAERLCRCLKRAYPALPIALLQEEGILCACEPSQIFRVRDGEDAPESLVDFCLSVGMGAQAPRTYALSFESDGSVLYLGYPLKLSGRGAAILRHLLYRAPATVGVRELLSVCFEEGTQRAENLAVQISEINRRAANIDGASALVECVRGKGYRLRGGLVSTLI